MDPLPKDIILLIFSEYLPDDLDKRHLLSSCKKMYFNKEDIKFNYINRHMNIIRQCDLKSIKPNIRRLTFDANFHGKISEPLPNFITMVKFKNKFDGSINDIIPESVTSLTVGNFYYYVMTIPRTVTHLNIIMNNYTSALTPKNDINYYRQYAAKTITRLSFS